MSISELLVSALAGFLTTLSPCVLPVLPLVIASSLRTGRRGPLFFVGGLLLTFVGVTWALSSFGNILGLDRGLIRNISALTLITAGVLFLSEKAQELLSQALAPLVNKLNYTSQVVSMRSSVWENGRQFILGALAGIIWTPCSGPSLGVAIGLASNKQNSLQALPVLAIFGLGAALPLMAIAYGSTAFSLRLRRGSMRWMTTIKKTAGFVIITIGFAILTGLDKKIESQLLRWSPDWLTDLTTRF
jgi:cytochrome c-type biogenesis protein